MEDNIFEFLTDENNSDDITLYDENNEAVRFSQIAVVPIEEMLYAILKPVEQIEGIADDEALVFSVNEDEGEESLNLVTDYEVIDLVFSEYYKLLEENGIPVD